MVTKRVEITEIEIRANRNNEPYVSATASDADGDKVRFAIFNTVEFVGAGWITKYDWSKRGETYTLSPAIGVEVERNVEERYWRMVTGSVEQAARVTELGGKEHYPRAQPGALLRVGAILRGNDKGMIECYYAFDITDESGNKIAPFQIGKNMYKLHMVGFDTRLTSHLRVGETLSLEPIGVMVKTKLDKLNQVYIDGVQTPDGCYWLGKERVSDLQPGANIIEIMSHYPEFNELSKLVPYGSAFVRLVTHGGQALGKLAPLPRHMKVHVLNQVEGATAPEIVSYGICELEDGEFVPLGDAQSVFGNEQTAIAFGKSYGFNSAKAVTLALFERRGKREVMAGMFYDGVFYRREGA